jgi:hypothetical protein
MIGSIAPLGRALTLHPEAPGHSRQDWTYYKNIVEAIMIKATTIHNLGEVGQTSAITSFATAWSTDSVGPDLCCYLRNRLRLVLVVAAPPN